VVEEPAPEPVEPEIDRERVRAAVTIALDQAMPAMIEELTDRVLAALEFRGRAAQPPIASEPAVASAQAAEELGD
jgi:hypothetical protein